MASPKPTHSLAASQSAAGTDTGATSTLEGKMFSPNSSAAAWALSTLHNFGAAAPPSMGQQEEQQQQQQLGSSNINITGSGNANEKPTYDGFGANGGGGGGGMGRPAAGDSLPATRLFSNDGGLRPILPHGGTTTTKNNTSFFSTAVATTNMATTQDNVPGVTWAPPTEQQIMPPRQQNQVSEILSKHDVSGRMPCMSCFVPFPSELIITPNFPLHVLPIILSQQVDHSMPEHNKPLARHANTSLVTPTPKKFKMDETSNGTASTNATPASDDNTADEEEHSLLAAAYSRKKKSLGVLAENFLEAYRDLPSGSPIIVDDAAIRLGVERRRIYDVVNILESICVVCKEKKNTYTWMGMDRLPNIFCRLQEHAIRDHPKDAQTYLGHVAPPKEAPLAEESFKTPVPRKTGGRRKSSTSSMKENRSLAKLAQEFLQVFLVGNKTLSLPQASDKIQGVTMSMQELIELGGGPSNKTIADTVDLDEQRELRAAAARGLKTKIRRLYDIANVFLSVGLLCKVENNKSKETSRRPHFSWCYTLSPADLYELHNINKNSSSTTFQANDSGAVASVATASMPASNQSSFTSLEDDSTFGF